MDVNTEEGVEIDKNEIKEAKFLPLERVREMLITNGSEFAPWTRELLKWYFHIPSKIEVIQSRKTQRIQNWKVKKSAQTNSRFSLMAEAQKRLAVRM
jgi:isopentenyldiphosphate isomerase